MYSASSSSSLKSLLATKSILAPHLNNSRQLSTLLKVVYLIRPKSSSLFAPNIQKSVRQNQRNFSLNIPNLVSYRFFHHFTKNSSTSGEHIMTNKHSKLLNDHEPTNYLETNNSHVKKLHNSTSSNLPVKKQHHHVDFISQSPNFKTMAAVQKLAMEPTREHIENIRNVLMKVNAKDNSNQSITMVKDNETGIASVCIKSAAKNAISCKMMSDLLDIVDELYSWPEGKGMILYGHGEFFCSGGDLVSVRELANYEDGLKMATFMQYILARLQSLPMITMALIQGKALGGGAEVAVTTDLRVMTKSAKFAFVHCRVGIVAAWGGGSRLVQLVGPSRAIELMSSGRLVNADDALRFGLINEIIDDTTLNGDEVMAQAKKYLSDHLIGAKPTIVAMKSLVNTARTLPLENALIVEGQILSSIWGKPPHIEALNNNVKHRGD